MRRVVDTNYLQTDDLRRYLSESTQNFAILTEYSAIEAYKAESLTPLYLSISVLGDFPGQVIILKNTITICGQIPDSLESIDWLIDSSQTQGFSNYCQLLRAAERGSLSIQKSIQMHRVAARNQMGRILSDAAKFLDGLKEIANTFTDDELRVIRLGPPHCDAVFGKVIRNAIVLAGHLLRGHPEVKQFPKYSELPKTFIFRSALCAQIFLLNWISKGGQMGVGLNKVQNDIVDLNYAAFALYFDGLLTNEKKLRLVHDEARLWLGAFSEKVK